MTLKPYIALIILFYSLTNAVVKSQSAPVELSVSLFTDSGKIIPLRWQWQAHPPELILYNAEERISCTSIQKKDDTLYVEIPVFQTELRLFQSDSLWKGYWRNLYRMPVQHMRVEARLKTKNFNADTALANQIQGDWELQFDDSTRGIARIFWNCKTQQLTGTLLTETGDYRYLQGHITPSKLLQLSAFDGLHAFLFEAYINTCNPLSKTHLNGWFYSGPHFSQLWTAARNPKFKLRNPETLTKSKTSEPIHFTFTDLNGKPCSIDDELFKNKVVILQLMGSWCPNCMDESRYFADLYKRFASSGLEIIALAFEKSSNFEIAQKSLLKLRQDLRLPYTLLYAGSSQKTEASKQLPFISGLMAYPTTLFLNRNHQIVATHTGFSGPATGNSYLEYCKRTELRIKSLLK